MSEFPPHSPCINVCKLDPAGYCIGCFRSGAEIARWTSLSAAEQWGVVAAARRRGLELQAKTAINE